MISIATPIGPSNSTCGYCSPPGTRSSSRSNVKTASLVAHQLSCEIYQKMIDRGWRRSGTYCYKPDLRRSCCPQYTIKLDALELKPSKSQRKVVNRWNRFILYGESDAVEVTESGSKKLNRSKGSPSSTFALTSLIHASEEGFITDKHQPIHKFRVTLEPSTYTAEKFQLYEKYQSQVHQDPDNSPSRFASFLVTSPLQDEPICYSSTPPNHLPLHYGSYHQMYRLDGQLIAMAVLDILPNCVSSVYFMYDDTWEKHSLGKLSALREASLAREMHEAGAIDMRSLYMGYYIHSCHKMRYKGDYSPSHLADPETYLWFPLNNCTPLLEKYRYACFSNPEHSIEGNVVSEPDLGEPELQVPEADLNEIFHISAIKGRQMFVTPVAMSSHWRHRATRHDALSCIHALGIALSRDIIFDLGTDDG